MWRKSESFGTSIARRVSAPRTIVNLNLSRGRKNVIIHHHCSTYENEHDLPNLSFSSRKWRILKKNLPTTLEFLWTYEDQKVRPLIPPVQRFNVGASSFFGNPSLNGGKGGRPIVCEYLLKKVKNPKGFSMFLKNLIFCERCVHFHMSSIDFHHQQIPWLKCGITVFLRGIRKSVFLLPGLSYKQFQNRGLR